MSKNSKSVLSDAFEVFQSREIYFQKISESENITRLFISQILIVGIFLFLYGIFMGGYHGIEQSLAAGVKLVVLFIVSLLICFPSFYIIQLILGSRIKLAQVIRFFPTAQPVRFIVIINSNYMVIAMILTEFRSCSNFYAGILVSPHYYFAGFIAVKLHR